MSGPAVRVGVDLVPVARVRAMTESGDDSQLHRMLTPAEAEASRFATGWDAHGVAGRLAAKEAVFKLLHVPGRPLPWQSIEILKSSGEWPRVRLTGPARTWAADAGIEAVDVSISHEELFAVAVAAAAAGRPAHDVPDHSVQDASHHSVHRSMPESTPESMSKSTSTSTSKEEPHAEQDLVQR
ncbi:holo-ACP synthase [Streptomyces sp. NPDC008001]|uniref:holo-ACP synthase n=1 Tax=Streptomyces sp. NPDC008001 TaxID=3364804 RepID=UPI0036E5AFB9